MDSLKLEKISDTLFVYQKDNVFSYGTDAVILSNYVKRSVKTLKDKKLCDLCSGTGIIPLMLCDAEPTLKCVGVEISSDACEISKMSAEKSNLDTRFECINADIKEIQNHFAPEEFDFVTCNPPYMKADSGKMCESDYKTIARHEILCNIDDVFKAAFYLLRTGQHLFIVYRADRLSSLFRAAHNNKFEIKDLCTVISKDIPSEIKLVLCKATKNASEGLKMKADYIDNLHERNI